MAETGGDRADAVRGGTAAHNDVMLSSDLMPDGDLVPGGMAASRAEVAADGTRRSGERGSCDVGASTAAILRPAVRGPQGRRPPAAVLLLAGSLFVSGTATAAVIGHAPETAGRVAPVKAAGAVGDAAADPTLSPGRVAAVQPLLSAREKAVRTGSVALWSAVLDPAAAAFRADQLAVFRRIQELPVITWRYELVAPPTPSGTPGPGPDMLLAHTRLHYRLSGDTRDVVREQYLTFIRRAGRWLLSNDTDSRTEPALWDLGRLTVEHGRRCLVIGIDQPSGPGPVLSRLAAEADAAAAEVDRVWGTTGPRTVVVIIPSTRPQMAAALGRPDSPQLNQLAAVTSGELTRDPGSGGSATVGTADRVVLNPGPFARLTQLGRQVVLTHELTHVATRATARLAPPLWVEEGFANYVAYRDSGLGTALVAADVLAQVREGSAPQHLPTSADFDPADRPIAPAYADAWLAFDYMGRDGHGGRPVAFYRVAAGLSGTGADTPDQALHLAFQQVLGTTEAGFETKWRAYRAMVGGSTGGRS